VYIYNRLKDNKTHRTMKTIAEQLSVTDFPFIIADKNDLVIYVEHSNRFWERHKYDSNGNEKYFEDSDGYYCEREFDSDGNVTYYKNSDGFIIGKQSINTKDK
jgi:hypothetical protein